MVNSEHLSGEPVRYKIHGVSVPLIEVPIMSLWRRRQKYSAAMIGNFVITLAQVCLIFAAVLLFLRHHHFFDIEALSQPFLALLTRER